MSRHGYRQARYWMVATFVLLVLLAAAGSYVDNVSQLLIASGITIYFITNCIYNFVRGHLNYQRLLEISLISLIGEVILLSLSL